MQDLLTGYLLPIALMLVIWLVLMNAGKRKRRNQRDRRRF
jgi:hypothetical protein